MGKGKSFLCFVHIEKAGGITLHTLLHQLYPTYLSPSPEIKFGEFIGATTMERLLRWLPFFPAGIGGHRMGAFLDYESVLDRPIVYFTMLRNPVQRYLSHLNWQKFVMGKDWTIETFLAAPAFNNFQAYRLCGKQDFALAKAQLKNQFQVVGLLERFDESLLLLGDKLGLEITELRYQRENAGAYTNAYRFEDLSPALQQKVVDNNAIDIALYEFVHQEVFGAQLTQYGVDKMVADVQHFSTLNAGYKFPASTRLKRKLSNGIMKTFVQPLTMKEP